MATQTCHIWIGAGVNSTSGTAYSTNPAWTVPSNITTSSTVNITIKSGSAGGYLTPSGGSGQQASDYYLCDSAGNNAVFIQTFTAQTTTNNNPKTVNLRGLAGKVLYLKEVKTSNGNTYNGGIHIRGDCYFTVDYSTWSDCTAPTSVSVSRKRTVCTVSWSGASSGTNNTISSYRVLVNTSASESGATTVNTGTTSTSLTSQPNGTAPTTSKTYYFGVRSQAPYNNSGYKWSGAVTVPAKPSVSAGTVITDTQMDTLRTWINTSGLTDIADGAQVKASEGNTYRNVTAGTVIDDAWYNAAATG